MKNRLLLAGLCLLFISIASCKKEDPDSLRAQIVGKWRVEQITTTVGSKTTTITYGSSDYLELRNSETDDVELVLNGVKNIGRFSSGLNDIFIDLTDKDLRCIVQEVTPNRLRFTATREQTEEPGTEVYVLSR